MENNEQFNIQGQITNEKGLTVQALIDFGIEDRDNGRYYVGSVYAPIQENLEYLEKNGYISKDQPIEEVDSNKLVEELGETDLFMDMENAITNAIRKVFDIPRRRRLTRKPECSDVDVHSTIPIMYGEWETKKGIEAPTPEKREVVIS